MSPAQYVAWKVQQRHLARLRRVWGVTGYELPDEERDGSGWVLLVAVGASVVVSIIGWLS